MGSGIDLAQEGKNFKASIVYVKLLRQFVRLVDLFLFFLFLFLNRVVIVIVNPRKRKERILRKRILKVLKFLGGGERVEESVNKLLDFLKNKLFINITIG